MAANHVPVACVSQGGTLLVASVRRIRTTGRKTAPIGHLRDVGNNALDVIKALLLVAQFRHCLHQTHCIRVLRGVEQLMNFRDLLNHSGIHDNHPGASLCNDAEIMGDVHHRHPRLVMQIACFVFAAGACVDILLLAMLRKNVRDHECSGEQPMEPPTPAEVHPVPITKETVEETVCPIPGISIGKIHDIGRRDYQQDSFGQTTVLRNTGILAVLADGMGGLSGGERVSQKIVMEALTFGSTLQANQVPTALPGMVAGINRAVNQMLGPKGLYTSGSTVVSALITGNALRWISVGDSRIYLYRDGQISQLSRDHDLLQDWMPDILEGKRSMAEALRDPNGRKLTSFIGMGELRHVDYNRTPIPLLPGDRVLLMSDGVYGTVSDAEMAAILRDCGSVPHRPADHGRCPAVSGQLHADRSGLRPARSAQKQQVNSYGN